jgi:5-formyltetrahydrofolate cyclo-ligase
MKKRDIRYKYKNLRKELSIEEIENKSLEIANNVLKLDIWLKNYFHIFLPIVEQNEVDTEYILHLLQGKDKEIIISKSEFDTREMIHFLMTDTTKIATNEYNIPEPTNGLEVPTSNIEVVFVPLLAYDKTGNRVGYGKGFYDKFLSNCKPQTIKIGLSFFDAEDLIEDFSEVDVKLDFCVTPNKIYRF